MNFNLQSSLKTVSLAFCFSLFFGACKKDKNPTTTNNNNNPVVVPNTPDTLSAGWSKVGNIPVEDNITDIYFTDLSNGYVTTNNGVYKSADGGSSWTKIVTGSDFYNIGAIGSKACFVNQSPTVYNTLDYGGSFNVKTYSTSGGTSPGFNDCFYTNNNTCYAASNLYIWKSTNGGASFDTIHNFGGTISMTGAVLFFSDDNQGWVARNNHLYKTTDGGVNWAENHALSNAFGPICFPDADNGFYGDVLSLFSTTDGGAHWNLVKVMPGWNNNPINDLHFFSATKGVCVIGTYIYTTNDAGYTWTPQVALGDGKLLEEVFFLGEHHGWACGNYGYVLRFNL